MKRFLIVFLFTTSCGMTVNQRASGKVQTENSVKAEIVVSFPICDNPEWSFEMKMTCIDLCNHYNVTISTDENVGKVLEQLQAIQNESANEPVPTTGGI